MTDFTRPPTFGEQREMLIAFNNLQRQNMLWKLEGLTEEQLRWKHESSGMCLLGLLKHLIRVEQIWFQERLAGEPSNGRANDDDAWSPSPEETLGALTAQYRGAFTRSNEIANSTPLDQTILTTNSSGELVTLQWVLYHMLEETARHLGHADIIREAIDGAVGVNPDHEARRLAAITLTEDDPK